LTFPRAKHKIHLIEYRPVCGEASEILALSRNCERQRILLARALCQPTPILQLDEPTAHLDLQYQVSLLELVRNLVREDNLAVRIALHDLNLAARYADRVALMVAGKITALGPPREVLTPELISHAYCLPVEVVEHPLSDSPLVLPR